MVVGKELNYLVRHPISKSDFGFPDVLSFKVSLTARDHYNQFPSQFYLILETGVHYFLIQVASGATMMLDEQRNRATTEDWTWYFSHRKQER